MATRSLITVDGNEAAASVAHRTNEVIAIYPITPSSNMGELADEWSAHGAQNIWGTVPDVIEMQSEGGAAGAVHGALQAGALTTTFTASQGLLLMIPNMYKIAGELTRYCMHVAARTLATHALSIFGDHSDVMACRQTGFALLASGSVQEAHDLALIAQAATLRSRVPFLHFFDGFRTSHEVAKIEELTDDDLRAMIPDDLVTRAPRARADAGPSGPARHRAEPGRLLPGARGVQPLLRRLPEIVQADDGRVRRADRAGRTTCSTTSGTPRPSGSIVMMGSGAETAHETVEWLVAKGEKVGRAEGPPLPPVRDRSSSSPRCRRASSRSRVLDRTKEPGALGEPLYLDVLAALREAQGRRPLAVRDGSDGRSAAATACRRRSSRRRWSRRSSTSWRSRRPRRTSPSASSTTSRTSRCRSTRSSTSSRTTSSAACSSASARRHGRRQQELDQDHRRGDRQLRAGLLRLRLEEGRRDHHLAPALRAAADPLDLPDQAGQLRRLPPVHVPREVRHAGYAAPGGDLPAQRAVRPGRGLGPAAARGAAGHHREEAQVLRDRRLRGGQGRPAWAAASTRSCRPASSRSPACCRARRRSPRSRRRSRRPTGRRARRSSRRTSPPSTRRSRTCTRSRCRRRSPPPRGRPPIVSDAAPDFVKRVTAVMIEQKGDLLPVSAFPLDGTWPTATTQWEKRNIALEIPVWDEAICIQCNKCALVCPHAAIRAKVYEPSAARRRRRRRSSRSTTRPASSRG